jgi:hypothetical protein
MKEFYQHGDVLIVKIEKIPDDCKKLNHLVLEEGEITGHKHQILTMERATLFETIMENTKLKFLHVELPVEVKHEEHKTIDLPIGDYQIMRINEYDPFEDEIKKVRD